MSEHEWQVASGSRTAHVIDPGQNWGNAPSRGEPGYRKSGPRSACGRYPQRHNGWAIALPVSTPENDLCGVFGPPYRRCEECSDRLREGSR